MRNKCNLHMILWIFILSIFVLTSCGPKEKVNTIVTKEKEVINNSDETNNVDINKESTSADNKAANEDNIGITSNNVNATEENLEIDDFEEGNEEVINIIDDNYRTYYEIFVASFYDSNQDGIGDLNGLREKLDYIKSNSDSDEDLGCNGIWLMPIMPSDSYHKYDVKDYYSIDKSYGTLDDFKALAKECDKRGIKLIIDFVMNHTSATHPWFENAVSYIQGLKNGAEPSVIENKYFGYYNFKKDMGSNSNYYRIGDTDWYYEGVFSSNMPDLNLDNPDLRKEFEEIARYWMELGVGGFRLDAAKEYFTGNDSKNVETLSWFNNYVKSIDKDSYIVAEVWSSFGAIAKYYESGIDSVFNYANGDATGKIAMTVKNAGNGMAGESLAKAMEQVEVAFSGRNSNFIDASFLSNHDNDRAVGYVSYEEELVKLLGGINLMMSGSSFIYYGEEIGMSGRGIDENKRAPMFWSEVDKNGMTIGPEKMTAQSHKFKAFDEQKRDLTSIFKYYQKAIYLRNAYPEIARGSVKAITMEDKNIAAISKTYGGSTIYLLYNISDNDKDILLEESKFQISGIKDYLTVSNMDKPILNQKKISLPAYSIVLLK